MRTFVALNLPADERDRLHAALEPLRAKGLPVKWVDADALHLTIRFLGDTPSAAVPAIETVLRTAAAHRRPITLRIAGIGAFPSLRRAEVLWVGVAQDAELTALHRELDPALSRLGFPREHKPFRPHITAGRTRHNARAPDIERHAERPAGERSGGLVLYESQVLVETVDLMLSHPGPGGSRYETLLRCRLGETPGADADADDAT